jgi:hypothetical protein
MSPRPGGGAGFFFGAMLSAAAMTPAFAPTALLTLSLPERTAEIALPVSGRKLIALRINSSAVSTIHGDRMRLKISPA